MTYRKVHLRSGSKMTLGEEEFCARDFFPSGLLPTKRMVLEMMIWHLLPKGKGFCCPTKEEAASLVADVLIQHWIWCNVYTKQKKNVTNAILKLYMEFRVKVRVPKVKQTQKWQEAVAKPFILSLEKGFDIKAQDFQAIKKQEELYNVKETEVEKEFWRDQMEGDRKMFCDSFVDKKWLSMHERKQKAKEGQEKLQQKQEEEIESMKSVSLPKDLEEELLDLEEEQKDEDNNEYVPDDEEQNVKKKRKLVAEVETWKQGTLPENWRHVRKSIGKVSNFRFSVFVPSGTSRVLQVHRPHGV